MLFRLGRLSFLALFVFLVYGWTHWSPWRVQSQTVLSHGWEATRQKFSQGASYADDLLEKSRPLEEHSSIPATASVTLVAQNSLPVSATRNDSTNAVATAAPEVTIPQKVTPYGYVFYVTQDNYACSALVNIERLQDMLHVKHRVFVLVSHQVSAVYIEAFEKRGAIVSFQTPPQLAEGGVGYYQDCLLKLLAFKMHHIDPSLKKIIALDSDQLAMKNLDHLFETAVEVDLAAPRAYWIARDAISSTFMLINLSDRLWNTVNDAIKNIKSDKYDMDLVNDLLADTVMMLPGSYVTPNSHWEDWNLPKWFHPTNNLSSIEHGSDSTSQQSTGNDLKKRDTVDLEAIQESRKNAQAHVEDAPAHAVEEVSVAKTQLSESVAEVGREAEQINASSGDIFDYLDHPNQDESSQGKSGQTSESTNNSATEDNDEYIPQGYPASDDTTESAGELIKISTPEEPVVEAVVELKFQHATLEEMQQRPLFKQLYELEPAVSVIHFFGLGKPWTYSTEEVKMHRPGSHPIFVDQFKLWRESALRVCPPGVVGIV